MTQPKADARETLDASGVPGNPNQCPSTHCERSQECRSPHECSGRKAQAAASSVPTTCIEHAYGTASRLSFQIKVF